jgi:hypothetical protein
LSAGSAAGTPHPPGPASSDLDTLGSANFLLFA